MSRIIYLNGELTASNAARIDVDDRGFLFGDGVYEAIRVIDGAFVEGPPHMERLALGMEGVELSADAASIVSELTDAAGRVLESNDLMSGDALVYMQVTRGAAPRTHQFPTGGVRPTTYVSATRFAPPSAMQERGASAITHPDLRWRRCDLKTVNLLPNVLAKQPPHAAGAAEALLVRDGVVTEGSHTNVFAVLRGVVRTHPCTNDILPGITRANVLRLARTEGLRVDERPILVAELMEADEVFITGTTTDVMPVTWIDGRPAGSGEPGPIARMLLEKYLTDISGSRSVVATIPV